MNEFDCPNKKCGKKAKTLIADGRGLGCQHCKHSEAISYSGILHQVVKTVGGRMTAADAKHIESRMRNRGKPDPRWR